MRTVPTAGSPPYIFLDVDGVLNNMASVVAYEGSGSSVRPWRLDEVSVQLVQRLTEMANAHVVVSSSWRGDGPQKFASMMALYGWYDCPVVGETRQKHRQDMFDPDSLESRGDLIDVWLQENAPEARENGHYLIIDDEDWAGDGHPDDRLVLTTFQTGFRHEHFREATGALNTSSVRRQST